MPTRKVLIVDPNAAFAEILRTSLEQSDTYAVSVAYSGRAAVEAVREGAFHLAIVDVSLADIDPSDVLAALRELDPYLRIAFIPPFGEELDERLAILDMQGVLHKPFIVGRLEEQLATFLQQKVRTAPPSRADAVRAHSSQIRPLLDDLGREVSAQVTALLCREELVLYIGRPPYEEGPPLARLLQESFEASGRLAAFLGERGGRFELTSYVGERLSLYVLAPDEDLALVVVPGSSIPRGVVHLSLRRAAKGIVTLLGAGDALAHSAQ